MLLELLLACATAPPDSKAPAEDTACTELIWHPDADGDLFGDPTQSTCAAESPGVGWWRDGSDCDDADPGKNPVAEEVCNGVDDNCDGVVDDPACEGGLGTAAYTVLGDGERAIGEVFSLPGDVDGDGVPDLAIGVDEDGEAGEGRVVLVSLTASEVSAADAAVVLYGEVEGEAFGRSLAGDDGLWVGANGSVSLWQPPFDGPVAAGVGSAKDDFGVAVVASAGSLLVGATRTEGLRGGAYLYRDAAGLGSFAQDDADLRLLGEGSGEGREVALVDVDGDGADDAVVTGMGSLETFGYVDVVHAPGSGSMDLYDSDGRYNSGAFGVALGWLATGDVDGDGRVDLVVGEVGGLGGTRAYVVLGPAEGSGAIELAAVATIDPATGEWPALATGPAGEVYVGALDANLVYRFDAPLTGQLGVDDATDTWAGEDADDHAGASVEAAGGLLAIGAPNHQEGGLGAVYVLWI